MSLINVHKCLEAREMRSVHAGDSG